MENTEVVETGKMSSKGASCWRAHMDTHRSFGGNGPPNPIYPIQSQVEEGFKVLGAMKSVMICRTLGTVAKCVLHEGLVFPTVFYGAGT